MAEATAAMPLARLPLAKAPLRRHIITRQRLNWRQRPRRLHNQLEALVKRSSPPRVSQWSRKTASDTLCRETAGSLLFCSGCRLRAQRAKPKASAHSRLG